MDQMCGTELKDVGMVLAGGAFETDNVERFLHAIRNSSKKTTKRNNHIVFIYLVFKDV